MDESVREAGLTVTCERSAADRLEVALRGRMDGATVGAAWRVVMAELDRAPAKQIVVAAAELDYCDGAGAAFFAELRRRAGGNVDVNDLAAELRPLVSLFEVRDLAELPSEEGRRSVVEEVGRASASVLSGVVELVAFVGDLVAALAVAFCSPRRLRWRDALLIAERAGVDALPIICLIGFLLGLILAFQSAMPMKQFGAEIFVADLVGLSMLKELGPLMTAIVLAGRSGSAFAAEIGTMTVNEEIAALTTMGLDPVRFLAVTRVLAAIAVTPLLVVFCNVFALAGGAVVLLSLGFPLTVYVDRIEAAVPLSAFLAGLGKSLAFAVIVAGIGCLRGLQTGKGASAVGESTTSAVVSGIVLVAIADSVFSVVFYALGI